jgi:hypothetical protein
VAGKLVVHETVALERVMLLVARSVVRAGASVATTLGVRLTVAKPVGKASAVRSGVALSVDSTVGVGVRVGERVGVGEKNGPTVASRA